MSRRIASFLGFLLLLVIFYLIADVVVDYLTGTSVTEWIEILIDGFR